MACDVSLAQDSQIITLEDGTEVRYFTQEQLRELAEQISDGESCAEEKELLNDSVENYQEQLVLEENRTNILEAINETNQSYIDNLEEIVEAEMNRQYRRTLFCRTTSCAYTTGLFLGIASSATIIFLAQ